MPSTSRKCASKLWEPLPNGESIQPGQFLARLVKQCYDTMHKYSPQAQIYTWSDMFCPGHNARPFAQSGYYYLVNGNWDGSWEGLPKDVVIMNWYSPNEKNLKFFADRGHHQIMCAFADKADTAAIKKRIDGWFNSSKGLPNIDGWMYVTYANDWTKMKELFTLINTHSQWSVPVPTTGPLPKPPGETDVNALSRPKSRPTLPRRAGVRVCPGRRPSRLQGDPMYVPPSSVPPLCLWLPLPLAAAAPTPPLPRPPPRASPRPIEGAATPPAPRPSPSPALSPTRPSNSWPP